LSGPDGRLSTSLRHALVGGARPSSALASPLRGDLIL
jgi:hypothetical protein